jgi:methionine sulfoxide reductase heme-binding subunit
MRDGGRTTGDTGPDAGIGTQDATRHGSLVPRPASLVPLVVIVICLAPAAYAIHGVVSDVFFGTRHFGSNPIKEVEHFTGDWILRFLVATLAITPARRLTGWNWLARYRRIFGLIAFTYACLHLLVYALLDVALDWAFLLEDVADRIYITIGMTAFVLMVPLAVTSTKAMIRRLGKKWVMLHRAIYVIVVLGVIHFWMSVKQDVRDPIIFAAIFAVLLGYRVWLAIRKRAARSADSVPPVRRRATA